MIRTNDIEIGLFIDGKDTEIQPSFIHFIYTTSIHNIIPNVELKYTDTFGLNQELLLFCQDSKFQLKVSDYRFDDEEDTKEFNIITSSEDRKGETEVNNFLSTQNTVLGYHPFIQNDEIKSVGYNDSSSNIVDTLINDYSYNFQDTNIISSNDRKLWFNPLYNDLDFIKKILMPNAYHQSETPFFCFIDSKDVFNYTTYFSMISQNSIATLTDLPEDPLNGERNVILEFGAVSVGRDKLNKYINKTYSYIDSDSELVEENVNILDYLTGNEKLIPVIDRNDLIKSYEYYDNNGYEDEEENNIIGKSIFNNKSSFFIERIKVTTTYNYNYTVGSVVELDLHYNLEEDNDSSVYYSGKFLIEINQIEWDNQRKVLFNHLILSRCNFNVVNDTNVKKLLIQE